MKKHKWIRATFFKSICEKCGCVKTKTAKSYPCKIIYSIDGTESERAGMCSERFVVNKKPLKMVYEQLEFNYN